MRTHGNPSPAIVYTGKKHVVRVCEHAEVHGYNYFIEPIGMAFAESYARKFLTQEGAIEWVRQQEGKPPESSVCLFICGASPK